MSDVLQTTVFGVARIVYDSTNEFHAQLGQGSELVLPWSELSFEEQQARASAVMAEIEGTAPAEPSDTLTEAELERFHTDNALRAALVKALRPFCAY